MLEEHPSSPGGRRPLIVALAVVGILLAALAWYLALPDRTGESPTQPAEEATSPAPPPVAAALPDKPGAEADEAPADRPRARRKPAAPKPAPAPAAPTTGELRIESDVPGAMVFLDRKYIGETPVTARDITPGTHQLNLSAEGFDGQSQTIEVAPGTAEVTVRFKEVRLNEAVEVVHKHGVGSCEGRLVADPRGVRYETTNKNDAFSLTFDQIEVFEVDYLKKNLRVKRRGGKTWNFTTRHENADPIFVFHRNVEKVREKMKTGT